MNTTALATAKTLLGASAIAIGALAMNAPAANAETFQHSCESNPGAYAEGAVLGAYSTERRGLDRDEVCKVYGPADRHTPYAHLLGTMTRTDYGYYATRVVNIFPTVGDSRI